MTLHCLILAAGAGSRFGGLKPLAEIEGVSLLRRVINLAESAVPNHVHLVIGCDAGLIREHLQASRIDTVEHKHWLEGIGSSIAAGVNALPEPASAVMILLCDQAAISVDDLHKLKQCYELGNGDKIVCARYGQGVGVPAIFPRVFFSQLRALHGDHGAKKILYQNNPLIVDMPSAELDIDSREDLQKLINIKS